MSQLAATTSKVVDTKKNPRVLLQIPSASDAFAWMEDVLRTDPSLKQKLSVVIEWNVDGSKHILSASTANNSDASSSSTAAIPTQEAPQQPPRLVVTVSLPTLQDLLNHKLTPQQAFLQRKLKIKGKLALALKLQLLLDAIRRHKQQQLQQDSPASKL